MGETTTLRYGAHRDQVAVLRVAGDGAPGPVVVLLHGGFWRWPFGRWSVALIERDARRRGWSTLTVGYRRLGPRRPLLARLRPGTGGWPATFDDVRRAIDLLAERGDVVDLDRVVLVGHSAGGHLALWAAAEVTVPLRGVVAMGAITDLSTALERGDETITELVAGAPAGAVLESTSPQQRLPLGTPVACVHGTADTTVSPRHSLDYVIAATEAGDDAVCELVRDGRHRDALRPGSPTWAVASSLVAAMLAGADLGGA